MRHYGGSSYPLIIITQRFYRQLIAILKVIANFSNVSNLRGDNFASGATDYDGEKFFICLCRTEKKARTQMKFNSQGVLREGVKEGMESSLHTLDTCLSSYIQARATWASQH